MSTQQKINAAQTAGILSLFLIAMGMSYIQALMNTLYEMYPDLSVSTVTYANSVTALTGIFGGLAVGFIASKRLVGYKPMAIIGSALFLVGGIAPVFNHDFVVLVVGRALLGFGMGFMNPIGNALITAFFEGDKRTRMLSVGSALAQAGALCMQLIAGVLADIDFWLAFLAPALSALSLIGAFLVIEPAAPAVQETQEKKEKGALPGRVWYVSFLMLASCLSIMPTLFGFSTFVAQYTDSITVASTVQMTYTVSMILGGLAFMVIYKVFKRFSLTFAFVLSAVGPLIVVLSANLPMIYIGMFLMGIGYSCVIPAVMQIIGASCRPAMVGLATSIAMAAMNVGSFLISPALGIIESITGDPLMAPIWCGIVVLALLAICTTVFNPFPKQPVAEADQSV